MSNLRDRIRNKKAVVGVIGLGYVGLPLGVEFAKQGFLVKGVDLDRKKVQKLMKGGSYIGDVQASEVRHVLKSNKFFAYSDFKHLNNADVIIICVPTPLRKTREPDVSYIISAVEGIIRLKKKRRLIVLESTTYPGTTDEVISRMLEDAGLVPGRDFLLVFSPERVDPGNINFKTKDIPKVVGGVDKESADTGASLYRTIIKEVIPISSTRGAEMVKLLENTFRIVNIGLVNELAMMCDKMNIDVWEVIDAAATKPFGFMPFYPGPGLGGHCIPIDPLYLSWKAKMFDFEARFIDLASQINRLMPHHVVGKVIEALNRHRKSINGAKIFILGLAYKKNVNDIRESPALDIIKILNSKGAKVFTHDSYIKKVEPGIGGRPRALTPKNLSSADCVILVTDHDEYADRLDEIIRSSKLIVDTRNMTKKIKIKKIVKL